MTLSGAFHGTTSAISATKTSRLVFFLLPACSASAKTDLAHRPCSLAGFSSSCKERASDQNFPRGFRRCATKSEPIVRSQEVKAPSWLLDLFASPAMGVLHAREHLSLHPCAAFLGMHRSDLRFMLSHPQAPWLSQRVVPSTGCASGKYLCDLVALVECMAFAKSCISAYATGDLAWLDAHCNRAPSLVGRCRDAV